MRLINTRTLRLEQFFIAARIPPYAILSHTWGDDEVSLQHFQHMSYQSSSTGFSKISSACKEAYNQGLNYLWVDTCCIDKTSSAELSEAINSMFRWYQRSEVCYAFCEDVKQTSIEPETGSTTDTLGTGFAGSRWFTRGWTLQELIAPKEVAFYNKNWAKIGEKSTSSQLIKKITGVDRFILEGGPLAEVSVGRRMSWAVDRQTTREEDIAYSLMGLFDINMPLIYGEGSKAFIRLQEEILRQSDDHTLFAWRSGPEAAIHGTASGLLADHPRVFRNFRSQTDGNPTVADNTFIDFKDHIVRVWDHKAPQNPITMTNKGIRITSRVVDLRSTWQPEQSMILILNCSPGADIERAIGIYIRRQYEDRYARVRTNELADVRLRHVGDYTTHTLHALKAGGVMIGDRQLDQPWTTSFDIRQESLESQGLKDQYLGEGTSLRRYQDAFQLCRGSYKAVTVFGAYIIYGIGIWQPYGTWHFFRFDPHGKSRDVIFDISPGRQFALLFRTPNRLDVLLVVLGVDATGKHWVSAMCVDEEVLTREGPNIVDILKTMREQSQQNQSYSNRKIVRLAEGILQIEVQVNPKLIEGIPMQEVHLIGPWPCSWIQALRRGLLNISYQIVLSAIVLFQGLQEFFSM